MRVSYSGNTPVFQTGAGGSIPPTRFAETKMSINRWAFLFLPKLSWGIERGENRQCLVDFRTPDFAEGAKLFSLKVEAIEPAVLKFGNVIYIYYGTRKYPLRIFRES